MKHRSPELLKLGENIRRVRENCGYSQDKFAIMLDMSRTYYGSLERGEVNPTFALLVKITRALDVELKTVIPKTIA